MDRAIIQTKNIPYWGIVLCAVPIAVLLGGVSGVIGIRPASIGAITSGILLISMVLLAAGRRTESIFSAALFVALIGYAMQGRGFAYLGISPIFVGELMLGLGVVTLVVGRARWRFSLLQGLLLLFICLGLLRTIPFLRIYELAAVRDSALWYYVAFALVLSMTLTRQRLTSAVKAVAFLLPLLVMWIFAMSVSFQFFVGNLPHLFGSPLPILSIMKSGDRAVILAALATFALTGLYDRLVPRQWLPQSIFWLFWLVSALMVVTQNRGGLLAIALSLLSVLSIFPTRRSINLAVLGTTSLLLLVLVNPTIETGSRDLSASQFTKNIMSIFSDETESAGSLQGTKDWRLNWWEDIWDYTVHGDYFWTGKGFGINLANDDGYQVSRDDSLRSPHSSHMTVLARMGVPGLVAWAALHLTFATQMVLSIWRSRRRDYIEHAQFKVWLLAMWIAAMVNSSFDVYLEGPQGAIIFWCVFGAGIAAMRIDGEAEISAEAERPDHETGVSLLYANLARS